MLVYGFSHTFNPAPGARNLVHAATNTWYMAFLPQTCYATTRELCDSANRAIYGDVAHRFLNAGATADEVVGLIGNSTADFYFDAHMPSMPDVTRLELQLTWKWAGTSSERSRIWFRDLGGVPAITEKWQGKYAYDPATVAWNNSTTIHFSMYCRVQRYGRVHRFVVYPPVVYTSCV